MKAKGLLRSMPAPATGPLSRGRVLAAAALAIVLTAGAAPVHADDWPQFLGPKRDGISKETDWSSQWPADGPKIRWSAEVGTGYCSITIADGRVYSMGNVRGNEIVYCLDSKTGDEIWRQSYPCGLVDKLHEGGPSATPTVHDGKVYTYSKEGQLHCFDAVKGEKIWSVQVRDKLSIGTPTWGFASSPLILGDLCIVEAGLTVAFNRDSGELVWTSRPYPPAYASVVAFDYKGQTLLASLNTGGLVVLDSADGRQLAAAEWKTQFDTNATTPLVVGDKIFISTGYRRGCALFQFTGDALKHIYTNDKMSNHMNNSVLVDGHLYGFDGNSHERNRVGLVCMELATGTEKWRQLGMGCGSLVAAGDRLIILSDDGELVIADASPAGFKQHARARVLGEGRYSSKNPCWTSPAIAHGQIYCRNTRGQLVCVDVGK